MNTNDILKQLYPYYNEIKKIIPDSLQITEIENLISEITGIPVFLFSQKSRKREKVMATIYLGVVMAIFTKYSLQQIGNLTNNDHATILHRIKTLHDLYQTDENVKETFNMITHQAGKILNRSKKRKKWYNKYISKSLYCYAVSSLQKELDKSENTNNAITTIEYFSILEDKDREIRCLKAEIERSKIKEINYYEK